MQYKGKLYGRIGGKYIDLEVTADDYDNLKKQLQTEYKRFDGAVLELAERDKTIAALKIENAMLERTCSRVQDVCEALLLKHSGFNCVDCGSILSAYEISENFKIKNDLTKCKCYSCAGK